MMKRIAALVFFTLECSLAQAQGTPVVGLWEQHATGDMQDTKSIRRHDVVFVDRQLSDDTVFSALMDDGKENVVLCCIKVKKSAAVALPDLLKKYPWDSDTAEHLQSIRGWRYIYEADVVNAREQNSEMRGIVKSLTSPASLSPYSAAIVSGKIGKDRVPRVFPIGDGRVSFLMRPIHKKSAIQYEFSVNGTVKIFSEAMFPD